jgi:hypothetical protein
MKKVYQKIVDANFGDCMQALIASLFELKLKEVPEFIRFQERWFFVMKKFFKDHGYNNVTYINRNAKNDTELLKKVARYDGGINGYFYASVPSQTFGDSIGHAVVVDTDLNIVHDPAPSQSSMKLTPNDVLDILVTKEMIIGKTGNIYTYEEFDELSEEEKDKETYK